MRKWIFMTLTLLFSVQITAYAQTKTLTAADASWLNPKVFPARVQQLQWLGNSDQYVMAKQNKMIAVAASNGKEQLLFNLETFNRDLQKAGKEKRSHFPRFQFKNNTRAIFVTKGDYYRYDFVQHTLTKTNHLPDSAENIFANPKNDDLAFTLSNNLYLSKNGNVTAITHDKNKGIVNGQIVSRNEFGIDHGIFWSPDGKQLAFYRKDERRVGEYPLVDINQRIAKVKYTRYPMAGTASEYVTLGVYHPETGKTVFLKTGDTIEQYLTAVTWGPESKFIYIALLNREQNHMWLNKYDAKNGQLIKTLFEEQNEKYVEPLFPLYFNPGHPNQFIWMSRRDGWNHMYLYDTEGKLLKQLTRGPWEVTSFKGFFMKHKVYFKATKESPLQQNLYSVDLRNGKIRRLTPDHGTHTALVSHSGKYLIDIYSNTAVSRAYKLVNSYGKTLRTIQKDIQPLKDYRLGKMTIFKLKSEDGSDLYCRMIKPVDFDSTKKYPVIVYVYGGPHAQLITDSWLGGAGLFLNYLASNGYLIFTLDNHGSANRGRDFEQVIHRHLGDFEIRDQMIGVNYLKSLPYVDAHRIGVDGWSYGGFMTTSLMTRKPGVFKVAVAGGPVIDWKYYEVMYGERYMDTPRENPEGYRKASLLNHVQDLKGHLLLIHGTMDPTVVWQNSLLFVQKAIHLNKLMDYFVYPGQQHGVRGRDRLQLNRKIKQYFDDYL